MNLHVKVCVRFPVAFFASSGLFPNKRGETNPLAARRTRCSDYIAKLLNPPSTTATVPVTNFAASLIR